jgi:hypothetical protein
MSASSEACVSSTSSSMSFARKSGEAVTPCGYAEGAIDARCGVNTVLKVGGALY